MGNAVGHGREIAVLCLCLLICADARHSRGYGVAEVVEDREAEEEGHSLSPEEVCSEGVSLLLEDFEELESGRDILKDLGCGRMFPA